MLRALRRAVVGRDRQILLATAVCAAGAPISAAAWVSARTSALAERVAVVGGGPARIGAVDADLTGTIRLSEVAFEPLVVADAVEASVALDSLLSGALRADEVRVMRPRVTVRVDRDGDSDLARVARRLLGPSRTDRFRSAAEQRSESPCGEGPPCGGQGAGAASPASREPSRLRRIVVSDGSLSAHVAGVGELLASGVELVPEAGGVRVITGAVRLDGRAGPLRGEMAFARSAADLTLPHLRLGRVLAVGGAGTIAAQPPAGADAASGEPLRLREVSAGRLAADGALALRATVDDAGIPRPVAIDVVPRDGALAIHGERVPLGAFAALAPRGLMLTGAHATGALAARRDGVRWSLGIDGAVDGVTLDHRIIAAAPVPLAAGIHGSIAVSPDAVAVSQAAIDLGAAHWVASGWLRRGAPASGQLDLGLATAPCGDLLASLPAELRGPLDGMVLAGSFGGRMRLTVDLAAPVGDGVELTTAIADDCRTAGEPPAADVTRLTGAADQVFPDGSHARIGPSEPGWIALHSLPRQVASAFVSAEDARFYDHAGFDLHQIARSLEIDLREHRLVRGGSTISQQLVKNAFLPPRRSFDRKLQEAILTWRLEARLDKAQILERYLNIIELGPRVYGLVAAAKHWFDSSPRDLSVHQAAFLAALTAEPTTMSRRIRRAGGLDAESAARVDAVLHAMRRDNAISAGELDSARQSSLHFAPAAIAQER